MQPSIRLTGVTKRFRKFDSKPSKDLKSLLARLPWKQSRPTSSIFTVLDNIDLEIQPGEFVGVMGRNGTGKSTIMKIISGVYAPTEGRVETNGLIAPLLELGAGFNEELSGYENIFLNAAVLGFSRKRVQALLNQIIDFAELAPFIHQPVRNYSSGMLVRLGFSIASHLDAPILLLDEVLGVGDAGFIKKSAEKIRSLHKEGRTIILVSHNPHEVATNCTRCVLFEKGRIAFDGDPIQGSEHYLATITGSIAPGPSSVPVPHSESKAGGSSLP